MSTDLQLISLAWAGWMWAQFWQVSLLIVLIALADRAVRPLRWPQLRLALWMLVVVKLLLPPQLVSPLGLSARWFDEEALPGVVVNLFTLLRPLADWLSFGDHAWSGQILTLPRVATAMFILWLLGLLAIGVSFVWRSRRLSERWNSDRREFEPPAWLHELIAETAQRVGLSAPPPVVLTARVGSPAVFGLFRATLLVPLSLIQRGPSRDLKYMLLHELMHIQRRDLPLQFLTLLVQMLYWFHPLIYLVRSRTYGLREICCDASVAARLRAETPAYRETLVRAIQSLLGRSAADAPIHALGLFDATDNMAERLRHLRDDAWRWHRARSHGALALSVIPLLTIVPMGLPHPEECCPFENCSNAACVASRGEWLQH